MTQRIKNYIQLIERFINLNMPVENFQEVYLEKFKKEEAPLDDDLFYPLDYLFAEANAFSNDPEYLKEFPDQSINESQLREAASKTLEKIRNLKEE